MQNYYKNKFGRVELPFNNNVVGLSMSGGADSTMLCYLLAKFLPNVIIQPINGFDLNAPGDSNKLPKIIEYIRNDFKDVQIKWPLSTVFSNNNTVSVKQDYLRPLKTTALAYGLCDIMLSGITMGPPIEHQQRFNTFDNMASEYGQNIKRIKGYNQYGDEVLYDLYDEVKDGGPFSEVDKRFVIQCYKDFDKEDLLNMTDSCVAFNVCNDTSKKPSELQDRKCWWCCERDWAVREVNNA